MIGDVGGHAQELRAELVRLGADPTDGRLPQGLVVVQVGDLIHRGPDSIGVLELVDRYLGEQPEQWVQLVGNHEAQYLRRPAFEWPERLDDTAAAILNRWWAEGRMRAAFAVTGQTMDNSIIGARDEQFLITHAGLTCGFWRSVLDRLTGADRAAAAINSLIGSHEDVLFHAGQLLGSARPDLMAGPIWAAAGPELVSSWLGVRLPFSQVHGHSTLRDLGKRSAIARLTTTDQTARHEITTLDGGRIIGVDPGHGTRARRPWRSFVIETPPQLIPAADIHAG